MLINKCIALKHLKKESYKQIIEKEDWSNCKDLFLLAKFVLIDDYLEAVKYMKKLSDDEEMRFNYIQWPLFEWFRETEEFHSTFKEIYGIEFEEELSHIAEEKAAAYKQSSEESSDTNETANEKIAS